MYLYRFLYFFIYQITDHCMRPSPPPFLLLLRLRLFCLQFPKRRNNHNKTFLALRLGKTRTERANTRWARLLLHEARVRMIESDGLDDGSALHSPGPWPSLQIYRNQTDLLHAYFTRETGLKNSGILDNGSTVKTYIYFPSVKLLLFSCLNLFLYS